MRRLVLTTALVVSLAIASPVAGAQPQRGCPPNFTEATIGQLVSQWPQFDPAEFEAFLLVIDANANRELCWAGHPENSAKFGEPFFVANFIDDVSNSQN